MPVLDEEQGLQSWGDAEVFALFLRKFAAAYQEAGDEVAGLLREERRAEAIALAHKLRGAAAAVYLTDVRNVAGLLERRLVAGEDPGALADELRAALETARATVDTYLAAGSSRPGPIAP